MKEYFSEHKMRNWLKVCNVKLQSNLCYAEVTLHNFLTIYQNKISDENLDLHKTKPNQPNHPLTQIILWLIYFSWY